MARRPPPPSPKPSFRSRMGSAIRIFSIRRGPGTPGKRDPNISPLDLTASESDLGGVGFGSTGEPGPGSAYSRQTFDGSLRARRRAIYITSSPTRSRSTTTGSLSGSLASEVEPLPPYSVVAPSPLGGVSDSQDRPQTDRVIEQPADQVSQITPMRPVQPPEREIPQATPPRTPSIHDAASTTSVGGPGEELRYDDTEGSGPPSELFLPSALPPAPTNCFSREEIVNEVLDLTDQIASTALFGSTGVGKSLVALTLLHHDRTKVKYGQNRHFIRCDDLANSLDAFLERLSDVINTDRAKDTTRLRSHLESSPPFILLLDGVDLILDPLAPEAEEISATIVELGSYEHVCLVTTSRMYPNIHGFHRIEVPTLPEDGAREAFYGLSNLDRSSAVDDLIARLDSHPLSIGLLANSVCENGWDEAALLKAWDDGEAGALESSYHQNLRDAVELSFRFPTIRNLGVTAREVLGAIASSLCGVEEGRLESTFPGETRVGGAVDVICRFSIVYRQDGFVKMLSPFRPYFPEYRLIPAQRMEVIRWSASCNPAPGVPPIYTCGPPSIPRRIASPREGWMKRFRSVKRKLLALFGRPPGVPINVYNVEGNLVNMPSAPAQQSLSVQAYEI